jgi:hypothetical protein
MRITRRSKPPYSLKRTAVIWGAAGVFFLAMHLAVWSVTSSLVVRLIFNIIEIAVLGTVTVNAFRTMLRANEEEVKRNPEPGDR